MNTIFFDTETTGLLKTDASHVSEQPYIIEFYGVVYDEEWNLVKEFESYIKPPIPLPPEIPKITGITEFDLEGAVPFVGVYDTLANLFLGCYRMVGHNLSFDTGMLANELIRLDKLIQFPWPPQHVCTIESSMPIQGHRLNLTKAYALATEGGTFSAHRARNDVEAMIEVYKWLQTKNLIS